MKSNLLINKDISLRALETDDVQLLYIWENDSTLWADSQILNPYSKFLLNQFLENNTANVFETGQVRLAITLNATNEVIGFIDLFDIDLKNSRAGIGILIATHQHRNKGFATQAVQCIERYAFEVLNLYMVYADIIITNKASQRLFTKAGFEYTANRKDWVQINRNFLDVVLYQKFNRKY